jgi:hypothetical protein
MDEVLNCQTRYLLPITVTLASDNRKKVFEETFERNRGAEQSVSLAKKPFCSLLQHCFRPNWFPVIVGVRQPATADGIGHTARS